MMHGHRKGPDTDGHEATFFISDAYFPCYITISARHSPTAGDTGRRPISLPAEARGVTWPRG